MKTLLTISAILLVIAVALIITKPNDEQCVELMKSKVQTSISNSSNNDLLGGLLNYAVGSTFNSMRNTFRIEDNIFYKQIFIGNLKLGIGIFGTFRPDDDLENTLNSIANEERQRREARVEKRREKIQEIENKIIAPFKRKESNRSVGNDLSTINAQIDDAYANLKKIKRFHLLRSDRKRESDISNQEQYIQSLEQRKRELQNQ